jgi:hypothetical protein
LNRNHRRAGQPFSWHVADAGTNPLDSAAAARIDDGLIRHNGDHDTGASKSPT